MEKYDLNNAPQVEYPKMPSQVTSKLFYPTVSNTALEQVFQYQAQMLASTDIIRAMAQKHLEESLALHRPFLASAKMAAPYNPWLTTASLNSYQPLFYPVASSHNFLEGAHTSTGKIKDQDSINQHLTSPRSSIIASPTLPPTSPPSIEVKSGSPISNSSTEFAIKSHFLPLPVPEKMSVTAHQKSEAQTLETPSLSTLSQTTLSPNLCVDQESRKRKKSRRSEDKANEKDSYPCSICGASYPHKFELNRHIKVSHVRPHRCNQCGKGFGHRNYLKVHIETVHLGQKSHQCRLCGKYLSTGGNLNVHVRTIHFGEKKYNCPVCSRSFGQQCNMKTHMKRHYSKSD